MADKRIDELADVRDVYIGDLPQAADIYNDMLIPVEDQNVAKHITGRQWRDYATAATEAEVNNAKAHADAAAKSAGQAADSASEAAKSQQAAKASETAAAGSADKAHASETAAKDSENKAAASASAAESSANESEASAKRAENAAETAAKDAAEKAAADVEDLLSGYVEDTTASKDAAAASAAAAKASQDAAKASEDNALKSAQDAEAAAERTVADAEAQLEGYVSAAESAKTAAETAKDAAIAAQTAAETAENNAATSASAANDSADSASASADAAAVSEANAAASADDVRDMADTAKSYAEGGTGLRPNEDTDNAKYYYEQAKGISQGLQGALLPMGTVTFANLNNQDKEPGYMYNISDAFTTDATFKEGAGHSYPAGTNVYWTADDPGMWDCLAGAQVVSVNGETGAVTIDTVTNANYLINHPIATGTDLNTLHSTGCYTTANAADAATLLNCPVANASLALYVFERLKNVSYTQLLFASTSKDAVHVYVRTMWSGAWGAWTELYSSVHPQTTITGNAATASKLATPRSLKTNLASTTAATFDGSANQDNIPITGILGIAHGGTGGSTAAAALTNLGVALAYKGTATDKNFNNFALGTITEVVFSAAENQTTYNAPAMPNNKDSWYVVITAAKTSNRFFQLAIQCYSNNPAALYLRTSHDATWSAWQRVYTTSYKPAASDIGAMPLGTWSSAATDYNNLLTTGWYQLQGTNTNSPVSGDTHMHVLVLRHSDLWVRQFAYDVRTKAMYTRGKFNGTWQAWDRLYTTGNKPTAADVGAPSLSGTNATGTWPISITGNAGSATKANQLTTARSIFGKSFNGTADVAGQGLFYGYYQATAANRYGAYGIQVREQGQVGSAQSDIAYAPGIGFHWAGKVAGSLVMDSGGVFHLLAQNGTSVQTLVANLSGNASSATTSASCSGNAATATTATRAGQLYGTNSIATVGNNGTDPFLHVNAPSTGKTFDLFTPNGVLTVHTYGGGITDTTYSVPSTTGKNATGTWGINITGSAGSATTAGTCTGNAATATTANKVAHSLKFTGGSTATFNGSADVSVALPTNPVQVFTRTLSYNVKFTLVGQPALYESAAINLTLQTNANTVIARWYGIANTGYLDYVAIRNTGSTQVTLLADTYMQYSTDYGAKWTTVKAGLNTIGLAANGLVWVRRLGSVNVPA